MCSTFFNMYITASIFTSLASIVTIVVNIGLKSVLILLSKLEYRDYFDEEKGAILRKLFVASYLTLVLIVVLSNAKLNTSSSVGKSLHLLQGSYSSTTRGWYASVAQLFISTLAIQELTAPITTCIMYYVVQPLQRLYHKSRLR